MRAGYLLDTDWIIDHLNGVAATMRSAGSSAASRDDAGSRDGTIGDFDLLIAATCLRHQFQICTNNRRHFEAVEDLSIVSIRPQSVQGFSRTATARD